VRLPDEGGARYEPRTYPHAHFLCSACGTVLDVPFALPQPALERLASELGVTVTDHTLALAGRCRACT
jgi:Fe2+ or Zn2+ uptake regulation protein